MKQYEMQWCVWTLVGRRLVAGRGWCEYVTVLQQPRRQTRTRAGSLFCRMVVLCHHNKNLSVKNLVVIVFVFANTSGAAGRRLEGSFPKNLNLWCFTLQFLFRKCNQDNIFFKLLTVFYSGKKGRNYQFKEQKKKKKNQQASVGSSPPNKSILWVILHFHQAHPILH